MPNLTVTIEDQVKQFYSQIDELVYINGTAQSFGVSPTALAGNLSFGMRELNGGGTFVELFNKTVNSSFSITHILDVANTTVKGRGRVRIDILSR